MTNLFRHFGNNDELDKEILAIQRSTKTLFPFAVPLHDKLRMKFNWYYKWHMKPQASLAHWSTLSVYIIVLASTLISTLFPAQSFASSTKTWDMSSATGFTYDDTKIAFANGEAKLQGSYTPGTNWVAAESGNNWKYRKALTVNNASGGTLTDYQAKIDEGEVGRWQMDSNANDSSGRGNNGTASNVTWSTGDKKFGTASGSFNGTSSYASISETQPFGNYNSMTISAWIKQSNTPSAGTWANVVAKSNTAFGAAFSNPYQLYNMAIDENNKVNFATSTGVVDSRIILTSNSAISNGSWVHVALTYDGSVKKIYINGSADQNTQNTNMVIGTNNFSTLIGAFGASSPFGGFNGLIDEVRIYNRALSVTEVNSLKDSNLSGFLGSAYSNTIEAGTDIRFTTSDGATAINNYWIEKYTAAGQNAKIWIKVPSLAVGDNTIYMYYGNASASANASATTANTFIREISNVQAAWDMNGTANDTSGTNLSSTANNITWSTADKKFGTASASMSGASNSYISVANGYSSAISGRAAFSVSMWAKVDTFGSNGGRVLWSRGGANNVYGFALTSGAIRFMVGGTYIDTDTGLIETGNWYHIVFNKTGDLTGKIYINGTERGTGALASTPTNANESLNIGNYWNSELASWPVDGLVDDMRVYSAALSTDEITALYGSGGGQAGHTSTLYANKELIRQYTATEPTVAVGAEVGPLYDTGNPTLVSTNQSYATLATFAQTLGAGSAGTIKYNLSADDGSTWYYWTGAAWAAADGTYTQANTAADVNTNIAAFTVGTGTRTFKWKAFLNSDGSQQPKLDTLELGYKWDSLAPDNVSSVTGTAGGSPIVDQNAWYTDSTPDFSWSAPNDNADTENGEVLSGVSGYYVYFGTSNTADPATDGAWQTGTTYSGSGLVNGSTYYFRTKTKDAAANVSSASTLFTYKYDSRPIVASLSISEGAIGAAVTITGQNFGEMDMPTPTVTLNGTAATISTYSSTSISTTVPAGATTGVWTVTNINGSGSSASFTVLTVPTAASGVTIGTITTTGFTATWTDNSDNETAFKVYVSTTANADCSLATYSGTPDFTTAADAESQAITEKSVNTQYCAKVIATNAVGDSAAAYAAPKYTLANVPGTPTVNTPTASTLKVTLDQNSNPDNDVISTANVNVGSHPKNIAVNATTNKTYVVNYSSNSVTVINGADNTTATVNVGTLPYAIAVNPVTNKIYVGNFTSGNVSVIDGSTDTVTTTISTGSAPVMVAINSNTNKIYVGNNGSRTVSVIDGSSDTVSATVDLGSSTGGDVGIDINKVTNKIYVAGSSANNVTIINGDDNTTSTVLAGTSPTAVAVNDVTNMIYVTNQNSNNVTIINGLNNETSTISVGSSPRSIVVNTVTNKIYVGNYNGASITVIDAGDNNSTSIVSPYSQPFHIAVNETTNRIYVASAAGVSNILVINGINNAKSNITTDLYPGYLAVNTSTGKVYVTNDGANSATVLTPANVTNYAIYETGTSKYVQANGTLGASVVWQSYSAWGGVSGQTVSGLTAGTSYSFEAKAKNGDDTETALSAAGTASTSNPTVAFTATTSSGAESTTSKNIEVSLSAVSGSEIAVDYAVTGGTATGSGTDYTLASGTATITAGQTSTNIALTIVNDTLDETDETVQITLSNPSNSTLGANTVHTYTITDNDDAPTVQFSATTGSGAESATPATATATLSAASGKSVTVDYTTANGTAAAGSDYTSTSGTLTFAAGETSKNIEVTITNDSIDEDDETVSLTLSNPSNSILGANTVHTYTITDNDDAPTVTLGLSGSPLAENGGEATVTATLSTASGKDVTVNLAFSGTATLTDDYTRSDTSIVIGAGTTSNAITLTGVNDAAEETGETIIVDIDFVTNGTESGTQQVTATITDDETPSVPSSVSIGTITTTGFTLTWSDNSSTETGFKVYVSTTANADCSLATYPGTADYTTDPGATSQAVTDKSVNTQYCAKVTAINSNGSSTPAYSASAVYTLANTPSAPTVNTPTTSSLKVTIDQNSNPAGTEYSFGIDNDANGSIDNNGWVQADGTLGASAVWADYTTWGGASGTVVTGLTAGTSYSFKTKARNGDNTETALSTAGTTSTSNPTVAFTAVSSSDAESTTSKNIEVSLSVASGSEITVDYAVTGGTATGSGTDYTLASGTATITAGQTSTNIALTIVNDTLDETDETVQITLSNPSNSTLGANTVHTYTITDNDDAPTVQFSATTGSGAESATPATATATLSAASGKSVTVDYTTANGTAAAGSDYTSTSGTLTFAAGETSKNIELPITNDSAEESAENFTLTLSNPSNATLGEALVFTYTINASDIAAPTNVALSTPSTTGLSLGWTDNSNIETGYKVYVSTTANADCSLATYPGTPDYTAAANATSQALSSLSVNTQYCAKVVTTDGTLDSDPAYSSTPLFTLANTPGTPNLEVVSSSSIKITVDQNGNPAGNIGYAIYRTPGGYVKQSDGTVQGSADWQTYADWGGASGFTNTGLSPNVAYTYKVMARNGDQTETVWSNTASATTLANVPTVSSAGDYDSTNGYHLDATIGANSNADGTEYWIQYSTDGETYANPNGMTWQTSTSYIFKKDSTNANLLANTQYWLKVKARNANSTETSYSSAGADVTPPAAPTDSLASNLCSTTALVSWSASVGANTYTVSYGTDVLATNIGTASSATTNKSLVDLSDGLTYYWKVAAVSTANGTGAYSDVANFTTTTCVAPVAPSDFSGTAVSTTQINWSWSDISGEDGYKVENNSHSSLSGDLAVAATTWSESELTANTAYTRHVNAWNEFGGNDSNQATVYTLANTPSAPTLLATGQNSIKITVNRNSNPEAATRYAIYNETLGQYVKNADGATQADPDWQLYADWGGASGFENTGLVAGTAYTYKVKARNGNDIETVYSGTAAATTSDPTVAFSAVSSSGSEGTTSVNVSVSLSGVSGKEISADYAVTGGTATGSGTDYTLASGTATVAAGQTSTNIVLTIVNDTIDEDNETVVITLSNPANATLGTNTVHTYTITDDDDPPTVTLSVDSGNIAEAGGIATVRATLSAVSAKNVTANLAFSGTATNASDYSRSGTSILISAGSTTGTITLTGVDDLTDEAGETVIVDLDSVVNGTESGTAQATTTLVDDDDPPTVTLNLSGSPVAEDGGTATFTVSLSIASSLDVTVNLAFSGTATLTDDYTKSGTSIVIPAGSTEGSITITSNNDSVDEENETVVVDIDSVTNGTESTVQQATATISDDDAAPTLSFSSTSSSGGEATTPATFSLALSAASGRAITVLYATSDGTAAAGSDYTAATSTLTFAPGETSKSIDIVVANDTLDENDETFVLTLSDQTNVSLVDSVHTYTINDNDNPPTISISADDSVAEDGGSIVFTVSLDTASGKNITAAYASADGTATAGSDYTSASGSLTFLAGETSKSVTVLIANDAIDEDDESFSLSLSDLSNATAGTSSKSVTITDNDNPPTVNLSVDANGAESLSPNFTLTLDAASGKSVTLHYATTNGTAAAGSDYTETSGDITIAAGETTSTIVVPVADDSLDEDNETFSVSLSSLVNATAGTVTQSYTITDNDASPTLSFGSVSSSALEAASTSIIIPVSLSAISGRSVTVSYATIDGTATAGSDYTDISGTLTFEPGESEKSITVSMADDGVVEQDESYTVVLSEPVNATLDSEAVYTYTIQNDDVAPTGTMSIDYEGSRINTKSVVLALTTDKATQIMVSNLSDFSQASYETYPSSDLMSWTLASGVDGIRTVYIKFKDQYGNESETYTDSITLDSAGPSAPTNLSAVSGNSSISLSWTNPSESDFANVAIFRSTTPSFTADVAINKIADTALSTYLDSSVTNNITYYYQIKALDDIDNYSVASSEVSGRPDSDNPTTPGKPTLTDKVTTLEGKEVIGKKDVTLNWDLSTDTNSGIGAYYLTIGTTSGGRDILDAKEILTTTLSNSQLPASVYQFAADGTYYARIQAKDKLGNGSALSGELVFIVDTIAPTLTGDILMHDVSDRANSKYAVLLSWPKAKEEGSGLVGYEISRDGKSLAAANSSVTSNLFESTDTIYYLDMLSADATATYSVRAADQAKNLSSNREVVLSNTAITQISNQKAGDNKIKLISSIIGEGKLEIGEIKATPSSVVGAKTQATVIWNSSVPSTSQVAYGTLADYTNKTEVDTGLNSTHTIILPELLPNTTYHYQVISKDKNGNEVKSADQTFTTNEIIKQKSVLETIAGSISEVFGRIWSTVRSIFSSGDLTVYAQDDISTLSVVNISTPDKAGFAMYWGGAGSRARIERSIDNNNWENIGESDKGFFVDSTAKRDVNYTYRVNVSGKVLTSAAGDDLAGQPLISGIKIEPGAANKEEASLIVIFKTDKLSQTQIYYGESIGYTGQSELNTSLNQSHTVLIEKLKPETAYHIKIKAIDKTGKNFTESADQTQTTAAPPADTSVFEVIIKALSQAFSGFNQWIKQ